MAVRVACGFGVDGESVSGMLGLPVLDQTVDGVNQAVLGDGVEEPNKVTIGSAEVYV